MNPRLARAQRLANSLAEASRGGVIHQLPGEAVEAAVARATASGRRGPFIVMPAPVSADDWERECVQQQQDLARRAAVFMSSGIVPADK